MSEYNIGQSIEGDHSQGRRIVTIVAAAALVVGGGGYLLSNRSGGMGTITEEQAATFNLGINELRRHPNMSLPTGKDTVNFSGPGCASVDKLTGIHVTPGTDCPPGQTPVRGSMKMDSNLLNKILANAAAVTKDGASKQ